MFRLRESIAYAKEKGLLGKRQKQDLAQSLWPESSPRAAYMNFLNLETGKSKKVDVANVPVLCSILGVSADYLFGISDTPTLKDKKEELLGKAREITSIASTL